MAGTFYGMALVDMTARMNAQVDGAVTKRIASEWVTHPAPVAAATDDSETRGSFLARVLRFATRPAARPNETGCATCQDFRRHCLPAAASRVRARARDGPFYPPLTPCRSLPPSVRKGSAP